MQSHGDIRRKTGHTNAANILAYASKNRDANARGSGQSFATRRVDPTSILSTALHGNLGNQDTKEDNDASPSTTHESEAGRAATADDGNSSADSYDSDLEAYFRACAPSDDEGKGRGGRRRRKGVEGVGGRSASISSSSGSDEERGLSGGQRLGGRTVRFRVGKRKGDTDDGEGEREKEEEDELLARNHNDDDDIDNYSAAYLAQQGVSPMRGKPSLSLTTLHRAAAKSKHKTQRSSGTTSSSLMPTATRSKAANPSFASSGGPCGIIGEPSSGGPRMARNPHAQAHLDGLQKGLLAGQPEEERQTIWGNAVLGGNSCDTTDSVSDGRGPPIPRKMAATYASTLTSEIVLHVAQQEPSRLFALGGKQSERWEASSEAVAICRHLQYGDAVHAVLGKALSAASAARLIESHCLSLIAECDEVLHVSSSLVSGTSSPSPVVALCALVLRRFADICGHIVVNLSRPRRQGPSYATEPASNDGEYARPVDLVPWALESQQVIAKLLAVFDACALTENGLETTLSTSTAPAPGLGTSARPPLASFKSASPPRKSMVSTTASVSSSSASQQLQLTTRVSSLLEHLLGAIDSSQRTCRPSEQRLYTELYIYSSWPLFELLGQGVTGTIGDAFSSISLFGGSARVDAARARALRDSIVGLQSSRRRGGVNYEAVFADEALCNQFEALLHSAVGLVGGGVAGLRMFGASSANVGQRDPFSSGGKTGRGKALSTLDEVRRLITAAREVHVRGNTMRGKGRNQLGLTLSSSAGKLIPTPLRDEESSNWGSNPGSARNSGIVPTAPSPPQWSGAAAALVYQSHRSVGSSVAVSDVEAAVSAVIGKPNNYSKNATLLPYQKRHLGGNAPSYLSNQHERLMSSYAGNTYTRTVFAALREGGTKERTAIARNAAAEDHSRRRRSRRTEVGERENEELSRLALDIVRGEDETPWKGDCTVADDEQDKDDIEIVRLLAVCEAGDTAFITQSERGKGHCGGNTATESQHGRFTNSTHGERSVSRSISQGPPPSARANAKRNKCYKSHCFFLRVVDAPFPQIVIDVRSSDETDASGGWVSEFMTHDYPSNNAAPPALSRIEIDWASPAFVWLRTVLVEPLARIVAREQLRVVKSLLAPLPSVSHSTLAMGVSSRYTMDSRDGAEIGLLALIRLLRDICFFSHEAMSDVFLDQLLQGASDYEEQMLNYHTLCQSLTAASHNREEYSYANGQPGQNNHVRGCVYDALPPVPTPWYHRLSADEIKSPYVLSGSQRITAAFIEAIGKVPNGLFVSMVVLPRAESFGGVAQTQTSSEVPRNILRTFESIRFHFRVPSALRYACPTITSLIEKGADSVSVWLALDTFDVYSRVFASLASLRYIKARLLQQMKEVYTASKLSHASPYSRSHQLEMNDGGATVRKNYILRVVIDALTDYMMHSVEGAARQYERACQTTASTLEELKTVHEGFVQSLRVALLLPPPTQPTASLLATQLAVMREAKQKLMHMALAEVERCGASSAGANYGGVSDNPTARIDVVVAEFIDAAEKVPPNSGGGAFPTTATNSSQDVSSHAFSFYSQSSSSFYARATGMSVAAVDYYVALRPLVCSLTMNDYFTASTIMSTL